MVNKGESYRFKTNKAAKYGPNIKCLVNYKRVGSCKKMEIMCGSFGLHLASGDVLRLIRGRNKTIDIFVFLFSIPTPSLDNEKLIFLRLPNDIARFA